MADKLDEILGDYREAVISVFEKAMGGDFTPIGLPNDQNLKAAIEAHYKGVEEEVKFYRNLEVERSGLQPKKVKASQLWAEIQNRIMEQQNG